MTDPTLGPSRRSRRVLAGLVGLALLAGACGGGDDDNGSGATGGDTSTESGTDDRALDPEATLKVGLSFQLTSLDPHINTSLVGAHASSHLVYDRLLEVGPDGQVEPGLATSWEYSEDGLTLTMQLRDDATFNDDGSPVTAEAVKASIERGLTAEGTNQVKAVLAPIESVEATGEHEVVFHLNRPAAELLNILADAPGTVINPAAIESGANLATTAAGSGPYVVDKFEPNVSLSVVRADGYWNPDLQKVARIEVTQLPDLNARINALRTGQIDVTRSLGEGLAEYQSLVDAGTHEIHFFQPNLLWAMRINNERLDDVAVRQAAMRAVDREGISQALFDGKCVATVQPFPEGTPGYVAELEDEWGYDPDAAKEILEDAGVPDARFDGKIMALVPMQDIAVALEDQFAQVGITYELEVGEGPTQFAAFNNAEGDTWVGGIEGEPFPGAFMRNGIFRPLHPGNMPNDPAVQAQIKADLDKVVDASVSDDERTEILEGLSRQVVENALLIPICRQPSMNIYANDIVGVGDQSISNFTNRVDLRHLGVAAD